MYKFVSSKQYCVFFIQNKATIRQKISLFIKMAPFRERCSKLGHCCLKKPYVLA